MLCDTAPMRSVMVKPMNVFRVSKLIFRRYVQNNLKTIHILLGYLDISLL